MSFVDFGPPAQRSFPERLQQYWENPHPLGLIAMLKAALNSIPDAVNGSIVATGDPPSTEEEAFRYNQARDRGFAGAFHAAETLNPVAPKIIGGVLGRRAASGLNPPLIEGRFPGNPNGPRNLNGNFAESFKSLPRQLSAPLGSVPSVLPKQGPISDLPTSGGLLGRLLELDAQPSSRKSIPVESKVQNPNLRRLSRVIVGPQDTTTVATVDSNSFGPYAQGRVQAGVVPVPSDPESLSQPKRPYKGLRKTTYKKNSNGRGPGGSDDDNFCDKRFYQEQDECNQRWQDGEFAVKDHYFGCRERARLRWDAYNKNGGWPAPWELSKWGLDPDEEIYINNNR